MSILTLVLTAVGFVLLLLFLMIKTRMHAFVTLVVVSMGEGLFLVCRSIKSPQPWKNGWEAHRASWRLWLRWGRYSVKDPHEIGTLDQIAVKMFKSFGHSRAHYAIGLAGPICAHFFSKW